MKNYSDKITIELFNCNSENYLSIYEDKKYFFSNIFNSNSKSNYTNSINLQEALFKHIKKRGFQDFVEIKSIEVKSDNKFKSFAIIENRVIKDPQLDSLINVLNEELDKVLYSALKDAKKDLLYSQFS